MEFTVEDISAVRKKAHVTVPAEEVAASLKAAAATIGKDVQLDGFRKGKVPASLIRKRFHSSIEKEAREDLVSIHLNEILDKTGVTPVSGFIMDGDDKPLLEGEPYTYTVMFEIMPNFDLPSYEGLEVEEESSEATGEMVDNVIRSLASRFGRLEPVEGNGPATDGQVAVIDFKFSEDGKPLEGYEKSNFNLPIGAGEALQSFEDLVKTIPVGHTGTGQVFFPEDFLAQNLAGRTLDATVTVHAIKKRFFPEINESLAKEMGAESVEELRQVYATGVQETLKLLNSSRSEQLLLDSLTSQVDFELPSSYVYRQLQLLISDYEHKLEAQGRALATDSESVKKLRDEMEPTARKRAKEKILLLAIAKKEQLEVEPKELAEAVRKGAIEAEESPREYLAKLGRSGMLEELKQHLLCDKAMDVVYERANVKIVPVPRKTPEEAMDAAISQSFADLGECAVAEKSEETSGGEAPQSSVDVPETGAADKSEAAATAAECGQVSEQAPKE